MIQVDLKYIQTLFKKRAPNSHKGNHGHALIIAGSQAKMGAAIIAAKACLRAGAGLVTVNVPKKERQSIFTAVPEAMIEFREEESHWGKYNAYAIGPGLGTDKKAENKIKRLIENAKTSVVFDADALNVLSKNLALLERLPSKSILTPHIKEFDRLYGESGSDQERILKAMTKSKELDCIIVLKSHQTVVTDGIQIFQNTTGNPGLAKGGSGDALTGIITAFLAQGYEPLHAAILGVYLHGLAADITLKTQSQESMLITDVIKNLGKAFCQI